MDIGLYEDVAPPVQGRIYQVAHSTTEARYEVPPEWYGQCVTFTSTQSDLSIAFGDGLVKIDVAKVAVASTEVLAPHWGSGALIPAGSSHSFPVPLDCTHFCVDSSAASGYWSAYVSSGTPTQGESLPVVLGRPLLWLDAGKHSSIVHASTVVSTWRCRVNGYEFTEGTNKPDLLNATATGAGMIRPAVGFTAGNSDKLVCTDATLSAALGSTNAWSLLIAARRGAAGANHTLFSVGTTGSNNGRWDFTLDSSDDPIMTRVTSGGSSTTSAVASTIASGDTNLYLWTFDGTTPLYWQDRVSTALTGTAAGDVGTTTKVTIGARGYNTSTYDQFATAQISDVIVLSGAITGDKRNSLHAWARRRYGQ